jgi:hypothetical protein
MLVGLVAALALPTIALAATLETGKFGDLIAAGDKCPNGAFYHFVNNQTAEDAAPGLLTTSFSSGQTPANPVSPYMVLKHVQHFSVFSTGTLLTASTNLDGKLVLSDIACKK